MKLHEILKEEYIRVNLASKSKDDLIKQMIKIIENSPYVLDIKKVEQAVFDRELSVSTGIGNGLAFPHGKTDGVTDNIISFAITEKPVDYDSQDEIPVRLVFFLVGRDPNHHLKLISRISRIIRDEDNRAKLLQATSASEVFNIIKTAEENLPTIL